ncbi:Uncharacterised protein [Mycobacteroides abscessus subsp. abscessus]|nr:Uncharacterised protein [Mycobacteroides abscessus subsp. abscessus]
MEAGICNVPADPSETAYPASAPAPSVAAGQVVLKDAGVEAITFAALVPVPGSPLHALMVLPAAAILLQISI